MTAHAIYGQFGRAMSKLAHDVKRVADKPQDYPQVCDLVAELAQAGHDLEAAAKLIEHGYPDMAGVYLHRARNIKAKVAIYRKVST